VDAFAQDVSFIAIEKNGAIVGYNVVAGGGMGMTHGEPETYPRAASMLGYCPANQAIDVAEKIVTVQRDFGNRSNRKQARLKYTIDRLGLDRFIELVNERRTTPLQPAKPYAFTSTGDRLGWEKDEAGQHHFTLFVENGRVHGRMLEGLHAFAALGVGRFIITPNQSLVLADIPESERAGVADLLREYSLDVPLTGLRRNAVACVALPTCGLALAESERFLPNVVARLETILDEHGLRDDEITIRMTGCPNGCARPYMSEIGLVGRSPGLYNLYLGGAHEGTRLSKLHRRDLDASGIIAALTPVIADYATNRRENERFGDFVIRAGIVARTENGLDFHENLSPELRS